MFNSDPIYYANHLFVNIYTFIYSDIVRAVLFNLILCEAWDPSHHLLVINHFTGQDWLPGVGQTALLCKWYIADWSGTRDRWYLCKRYHTRRVVWPTEASALNDNCHSSVFVERRLCKLIVFMGLVIEVSITVVGPSGALCEWIYRCSLICLMTSGRDARACDAVAEQGCAGGASGGATLELQHRV